MQDSTDMRKLPTWLSTMSSNLVAGLLILMIGTSVTATASLVHTVSSLADANVVAKDRADKMDMRADKMDARMDRMELVEQQTAVTLSRVTTLLEDRRAK